VNDSDLPRDSLRGTEILSLVARFPRLSHDEIVSIVERCGPKRSTIEQELSRLAATKG
jgi:hypothetical protein